MEAIKISSAKARLANALQIRGIKQAELAAEIGINKGTMSRYLSGKYEPKMDVVCKLAEALNCSEWWLLGYDVPMDREMLPAEVEAVNTLLYATGRQIMKCDGEYFLDECGKLTDEELNDIINTAVIAIKSTTDVLIGKRNKELVNYLKRKGSQ